MRAAPVGAFRRPPCALTLPVGACRRPTVRADPPRRRLPTPTVRADRSRADCARFARVAMRAAAPRCARLLPGCVRNGLADARCAPSPSAPAAAPPCAPTLPARIVPGSRGLRCARLRRDARGYAQGAFGTRLPTPTVRLDPSRRRLPTPTVRADPPRAGRARFARVAMRAAAPRCARPRPGCGRNGLADAHDARRPLPVIAGDTSPRRWSAVRSVRSGRQAGQIRSGPARPDERRIAGR